MRLIKSKKFLIFLILIIVLFLLISIIFYKFNQVQKNNVKKVSEVISKKTDNYKAFLNPLQVESSLDILNNKKLPNADRYKALQNITFYFSLAYSNSHDPDIRTYISSLKDFAKENFPKEYQEADFIINCADPTCGEKQDNDIKQIRKEINDSGIDPIYLRTINTNFDQASFIPISQDFDKQYGFGLVLGQLEELNNPKASSAAMHLKIYLKKKYSFEYSNSKP